MRPVRFVHTSDLHLDTSFSASGFPSRIGNRKREAIRGTFKRILREAAEVPVDLILIAGDLFEHDRVTPDTVEFLKLQFESLGTIPVFIAPGNHDPYLPGSPYREESWPANVRIFTEERFNTVELSELGVRVTGFGFTRSRIEERAFLEEVIRCYRVQAFRATVVMAWNLAYDHVLHWILNDPGRLATFNARIPVRHPNKKPMPVIAKFEDFEKLREAEVIEVCSSAGLITSGVFKILEGKLDRRNTAGHPSKVEVLASGAEDAIQDLVVNVVLKLT